MSRNIFIILVRFYQIAFSFKKPCCRFFPSCSAYAIEAIEKHGTLKGLFLSTKRILKCRPGSSFGYDPVPEKISSNHNLGEK